MHIIGSKPESLFLPVIDNGGGLSRTSWAISMMALFMSHVLRDGNREVTLQGMSFPYPDGAMNVASLDFLETGLDAMLIIDTDVIFQPKHVEMLLGHDVPLIAGLYPKKVLGLEFPVIPLQENPNPFSNDRPAEELCEVQCAARGFMKIRREVFDALKPIVPKYQDTQTGREGWEFWRNQLGGHSDDFNFCNLYRSVGGKVLIDKRVTVKHEGSAVYPIPGTFAK